MLELIIGIIVVALIFDFYNGMHDAANSIATVVSTRVLPPKVAVVWAAVFNFTAFLVMGVAVATTIGKGIVNPSVMNPTVVLTGLIAAIIWQVITIRLGIPISSSHSLIGGLVGSAGAIAGFDGIILSGFFRVIVFIALAPILGIALGFTLMMLLLRLSRSLPPRIIGRFFGRLQLVSAAFYSLGHGGNDAQKTMGIITVLLFTAGYLGGEFYVPLWVVLISHGMIALGTYFGGWRIVRTMGMRLTKLQPINGFAAETSAGFTLAMVTFAGIPVSTTHTISGGIIGVGATRRLSAVRWGVARNIVWAWILTIPLTSTISGSLYLLIAHLGLIF